MPKNGLFLLTFTMALVCVPGLCQEQNSADQITSRIQDKLYHAHVMKHGKVQVSVENGVVTLTGTVDSVGVKMDAERAAHKVDDVDQVVDNIRVDTEDVTERQIVAEARHEILTYYAYSIFDWITLEVNGNTLVVNGEVVLPFKKDDIGNFLSHIKGVADLKNNLEVLPVSQFDDSLRWAVARAIYNDPYFANYANQALPPIHIIVKNGDVTLEGVVLNAVDRAKAQADAQFAGTYFALNNHLMVETGVERGARSR